MKIHLNENDCPNCNYNLAFIKNIDTSSVDVELYVNKYIENILPEVLDIPEKILKKYKIIGIENYNSRFIKKIKDSLYIMSSYVTIRCNNNFLYDSFSVKEIGQRSLVYQRYLKINETNQSENKDENYLSNKIYSKKFHIQKSKNAKEFVIPENIKTSYQIIHAFYHNNKLCISDFLLNKLIVLDISDTIVKGTEMKIHDIPKKVFFDKNCIDTAEYNSSLNLIKTLQVQTNPEGKGYVFMDDTALYSLINIPYFVRTRNDDSLIKVTSYSKPFLLKYNFQRNTMNIFCILNDGIQYKIEKEYILRYYKPFFINKNNYHFTVINGKDDYDVNILAAYNQDADKKLKYIKLKYTNTTLLNSIINFNINASVNNSFYFFSNDFVFYNFKQDKWYGLKKKQLNIQPKDTAWIYDCIQKDKFLYVIYSVRNKTKYLEYNTENFTLTQVYELNVPFKYSYILFKENPNDIIFLNPREIIFKNITELLKIK